MNKLPLIYSTAMLAADFLKMTYAVGLVLFMYKYMNDSLDSDFGI